MQNPSSTHNDQPSGQATAAAAPIEPSAAISSASGGQQYITFGTALILCLITAVITLMVSLYAPAIAAKRGIHLPGASSESKIVHLDFEKVVGAGMKKTMEASSGVSDVQAQAEKFQVALSAAVQAYADAGFTVINSKALIGTTTNGDITGEVLNTLGVKP